MNERIQQLIKECGVPVPTSTGWEPTAESVTYLVEMGVLR